MANPSPLHVISVFDREKTRVLDKVDLSRKGSVDAPIRDLVSYINAQSDYYTSSSCSGRTVVFCEDNEQKKKGCHWLLVSHDLITVDNLTQVCSDDNSQLRCSQGEHFIETECGYTFLKFEPFILHVMCRDMDCAQAMLQVSVGAGFRNSGITFGKKGKIMLGVRSTHSLEIPLKVGGEMLVDKKYLNHLVKLCNDRFTENTQRIEKFFEQLKSLTRAKVNPPVNRLKSTKSKNSKVKDREHSLLSDSHLEELCFETLFPSKYSLQYK